MVADDDAADYLNITSTIDSILKTYDIRLRPNFGDSPVTVEMDMDISSMNSISEVNMDYTLTMYFRQYWKDERLAYDPRFGNISFDGRMANRIWVPDTYFVNDKHAFIHDVTVANRMIRFHYDGSVLYGLRITTVLSCMMDLHDYPLDVQNCTLEIESYGYTTEDVTYAWQYGNRSVQGLEDVQLPQFVLEEYRLVKRQAAFSTGSYPRLSLEFRLRRSVGFFILQTYLPCILIVMLSWVSFWINHEATSARVALVAANKQVETARTTIGITTVLTMTTISTSVRASLPRISYIKAIDIYLVTSFAFVFAALLEYAIVNYNFWQSQKKITKENNRAPPPPATCQHRIPNSIYEQSNRTVALRLSQLEDERSASPEHTVEEGIPECTNMRTYNSSNRNAVKHRKRLSLDSRRCSAPELRHRKGFVYSVRRKASSIKVKIPRVHDVNIIDKYSRLIFPLTFTIFNLFYWCLYLI
ncbi:gamma-aminobutyric acid receptor subunit beta-3-like [Saccoglossus kowalevskii]|uniref:Gamma-aminobutyric acid receptor subunit beta-3-like n=1 Tax=Saccoglossus kowalevskii TaxID=10224 RepID=A0ABM0M007_SACKO|nr:PREDICTED: gamma-aminobutyric acid receptor subunit beta-3-like [Saccoglossus kowalevskii]